MEKKIRKPSGCRMWNMAKNYALDHQHQWRFVEIPVGDTIQFTSLNPFQDKSIRKAETLYQCIW